MCPWPWDLSSDRSAHLTRNCAASYNIRSQLDDIQRFYEDNLKARWFVFIGSSFGGFFCVYFLLFGMDIPLRRVSDHLLYGSYHPLCLLQRLSSLHSYRHHLFPVFQSQLGGKRLRLRLWKRLLGGTYANCTSAAVRLGCLLAPPYCVWTCWSLRWSGVHRIVILASGDQLWYGKSIRLYSRYLACCLLLRVPSASGGAASVHIDSTFRGAATLK